MVIVRAKYLNASIILQHDIEHSAFAGNAVVLGGHSMSDPVQIRVKVSIQKSLSHSLITLVIVAVSESTKTGFLLSPAGCSIARAKSRISTGVGGTFT